MTALNLRHLGKTYPGAVAPVVGDLSLDLASGEMAALLGPSGCGKTTVLKMIAGLLAPDAGDILVDGASVLRLEPEQRGVVLVLQNPSLFPHMTLAENIGFGLRMRGRRAGEIATRVGEMLELVHLPGLGSRRPGQLSGGQQQRAALARAMILRPKVLLLDEPLSSLDAHLRAEMRDLIRSLQRATGTTTLLVTHDQEEAVVLADRVALMMEGRIVQHDVAEALYRRPAETRVARFFGGTNLVPGEARDGVFHSALGPLALPAEARAGQGMLTIRPEAIRLGPAAENSITAVVAERAFLGTRSRLTLSVGEVRIEAVLRPDEAEGLAVGDAVAVCLPRAALWVMA